MNKGRRSKRATFMIADLLSNVSQEPQLPLPSEVNSSNSATGSDAIASDLQSPAAMSRRRLQSVEATNPCHSSDDAAVPIARDALLSAAETIPHSRATVVRPIPAGYRVTSSSCIQAPEGGYDRQAVNVALTEAAGRLSQSLEQTAARYVTPLHWHIIQHAVHAAGLARREQADYRQSTSDVHQVALQTLFPVFQSASGPVISQRAVAAADSLSNGVDQLVTCGDYHRHSGDFLNRTKYRRNRTVFTDHHLRSLERSFQRQKYLSTKERSVLAARLGLSQIQIKTWYQNRRMKWKKQVLEAGGREPPTKPKGRPRKQDFDDQPEDSVVSDQETHDMMLNSTTNKTS